MPDRTLPPADAESTLFWLPFAAGSSLDLAPGAALFIPWDLKLPFFLAGDDARVYAEEHRVPISSHTLLMGILLGWDRGPTLELLGEGPRSILQGILRRLADRVFRQDLESLLLGAGHWLRTEAGVAKGRLALITARSLLPESAQLASDCLAMTWQLAEHSSGDEQRRLLEEVARDYPVLPTMAADPRSVEVQGMVSYLFCAALGILGWADIPGFREKFTGAQAKVADPVLWQRLVDCRAVGRFSMAVCRLAVPADPKSAAAARAITEPLPEALCALTEGPPPGIGTELFILLREWLAYAPVRKCGSEYRREFRFLRWAAARRLNELLPILEESAEPLDHQVAARIRMLGDWCLPSGPGIAKAMALGMFGWVGVELGNPTWKRQDHTIFVELPTSPRMENYLDMLGAEQLVSQYFRHGCRRIDGATKSVYDNVSALANEEGLRSRWLLGECSKVVLGTMRPAAIAKPAPGTPDGR